MHCIDYSLSSGQEPAGDPEQDHPFVSRKQGSYRGPKPSHH